MNDESLVVSFARRTAERAGPVARIGWFTFSVDVGHPVRGPETTRARGRPRWATVRGVCPAPSWCSRLVEAVDLVGVVALLDVRDDQLDGAINGNAVVLRAVTQAEGHGPGLDVLATGDEREGDLVL